MMTVLSKGRRVQRLLAACAIAAAGGLVLAAAPAADAIRLIGVSAQATGRSAAVLIEATQPVAYSVSRPDALTVLVDLRNVTVDTASPVPARGPIKGVALEQATAIDGKSLARVRVSLASPLTYKVRSVRNVIHLDLEPGAVSAEPEGTPAAVRPTGLADSAPSTAAAATEIEAVHAKSTRTSTTVTLSGNGRLNPSALSESEDPRRVVLDFPNVAAHAPAQTAVDSVFVKKVRVALNTREPLVTRVVMEIAPKATYHVERTGPDGRDLAVVFEGPKGGGAVLVAPPTTLKATVGKPDGAASASDDEDKYTLAQAMANAAPLMPRDPITALGAASGPKQTPAQPPTTPNPQATPQPQVPSASSGQAPAQTPPQPPATPPPAATPAQPQTITTAVPGSGPKQYVGHPINFDFEDADLRSVLRVFSQESGLNMIIDPTVQGRVNVLLNDVPWDQALDQILRANKLGYTIEGNIIRIAPITVLTAEQKERADYQAQQALAGELQVRTFPLSYAKADALGPILVKSALSQRGQIQTDVRTNTLILMDLPDRLQTAESLIQTLDRPQPQVEVEARVVQTTRDFARALGIQWGFNGRANSAIGNTTGLTFPNNGDIGGRVGATAPGTGFTQGPTDPRGGTTGQNTATVVNLPAAGATSAIGLALGAINGAFNLDVALSALENTGKGRVLSTPRLTTQNNQPAEVAQGVQIPIQTVANNTVAVQFKDATLMLKVTPQITQANTVIMTVELQNATPDFSREVNGIPPIDTQRALTTVQVNDGATTVIGGIFVSQEQTSINRTPVLYRVPILKWLFQNNSVRDSSTELLIFITPRILRG